MRDDHIDFEGDQLLRETEQPSSVAFSGADLEPGISVVDEADVAQSFAKNVQNGNGNGRSREEDANRGDLALLSPRPTRSYDRRASDPYDEVAADHSTTSSALVSSVDGTLR